jgi:hypothetical protein
MDATDQAPHLDSRGDRVACAALLLAMVISALCGAFVIDVEASASEAKSPPETHAHCQPRGISIP